MSEQPKVDFDRAMAMSLDQYIAENGITIPKSFRKEKENKFNHSGNKNYLSLRKQFGDLQISSSSSSESVGTWENSISPVIMNNLNNMSNGKGSNGRNNRNRNRKNMLASLKHNNNNSSYRQHSLFKNSNTTITFPELNNNNNSLLPSSNNIVASLSSSNSKLKEFEPGLMPKIAENLLNVILEGSVNMKKDEPKYDLKVQKEIHSIQGKPMFYKCPGGEVISSDGPGVDFKFVPNTTGLSLNQRFA